MFGITDPKCNANANKFPLNFLQEVFSQFICYPTNAFVVVECQDVVDKNILYIVK